MKIAQIGSFPLNPDLIKGGVEASILGLSNELSKNHEVVVFDMPRREIDADLNESMDQIQVFRYKNYGINNNGSLNRIPFIVKQIRAFAPDICHLHGTNLFSLFLFLNLRVRLIPSILTVHGLLHIEQYNLWKQNKSLKSLVKYISFSLAEFFLLSVNQKVIVDTKYVEDQISLFHKQWKIWRKPKCFIIPQGIDQDYFSLPDHYVPTRLLSIGGIQRRKGHIHLIEVLPQVLKKYPNTTLDIAGVLSDKNYYELLINKIKALSLEGIVNVHVDLSLEKLKQLYIKANIFVLHSEEESQGIVLCEAMASGKPIVATNVGGIPDIINEGRNGFLSDFNNPQLFAFNILKLLSNPDLRQEISSYNRNNSQQYDWEVIAGNILKLYEKVH